MDKMETIMPQAYKAEAEEILALLKSMQTTEQRDVLAFLHGVQLGRSMAQTTQQAG